MIWTIFKKELRGYFSSPVAYVFIVFFLFLVNLISLQIENWFRAGAGQAQVENFFRWHMWLLLFLVPAISMRSWAEERRANTIELLFTSPITSMQATLGKFFAGWTLLAITITISALAAVATADYLGKPDYGIATASYVGSILMAGTFLSVGMFTSALCKSQVISFILGVVIIFVGLILLGILSGLLEELNWFSLRVVEGVASFSVMDHFDSMRRGVIAFKDLFYFASVMVFMLITTNIVLQNRATR